MGTDLWIILTNIGVAVGTIFLAGAALMVIKQSKVQFRDDRRERKLITIITWANDIAKCETAVPLPPLSITEIIRTVSEITKNAAEELGKKAQVKKAIEVILEYRDRHLKVNLGMRYQVLNSMGAQIVLISKGLDKQLGSKLECLAQKTTDKLTKHVEMIFKMAGGEITPEEYRTHLESLLEMAQALAKEATECMS